jgi:beta-N-acetylhexosaminidase
MGGITAGRGQAQAAVEAVQAGVDILLSTSPLDAHIAIIENLVAAVQREEIPVARIDQSVLRILRVKHAYGLFDLPTELDVGSVGVPEHQTVADEIARQAVTLLRDDANYVPLLSPPARLLLLSPQQLVTGSEGGTLFAQLLRERGYEVNETIFNLDSGESRNSVYASAVAQAPAYDQVIFGEWELVKRFVNWDDRWQEQLIQALGKANPALIVVAWHNPAALVRCSQVPTFLTAYGDTQAQVGAVVAVLAGAQVPTGHSPIPLTTLTADY